MTLAPLRLHVTAIALFAVAGSCVALADPIPAGGAAHNLKVVGFSALGGRYGGFKMALNQAANGRWYLYQGHSFDLGLSILDVTDPTKPQLVKYIPFDLPKKWITSQVTVHGSLMITAVDHRPDPKPGPSAIFWDISDPVNPKELSRYEGVNEGTHRNSYPGGRYAYMSTSYDGFNGRILLILDVSDPAHPKEAGKWWQPGQKNGETPSPLPATYGPVTNFHGPANVSPDGKMITTGYSPDFVNLDITDPANPKLIGKLPLVPPFPNVAAQSLHSVLPLWDRKLAVVSSEAMLENCKDPGLHGAYIVDNSNPAAPYIISMLPTPTPPPGSPYSSYCEKGGRFGPHNTNQEIHNSAVEKPGNLLYFAWFNAGLRIFDISNARAPKEVAYYIPPERHGLPAQAGNAHDSAVNWTEEVAVDARGNIYISDDKWGTFILRYTGPKPATR